MASELRKDPIVGRWVIVAPNRAQRPNAFARTLPCSSTDPCPFCEGNEHETPLEVIAYRRPHVVEGRPVWQVRVVPNKYPALEVQAEPGHQCDGIYDWIDGAGAHEVIIESPRHLVSSSDLSDEELSLVFSAYRQRLSHWKRDPRILFGMIFKNVGAEAGASLEHTHSQMIATPIVPINVREEMAGALEFFNRRGRCVFCEMIRQELDSGQRVVLDTPEFLAFLPFAGRLPFETWVVPKKHVSHYEDIEEGDIAGLAKVVREVVRRIETALDGPAYNYFLHTAPFDTKAVGHYHWHIEIIPILTRTAGFEWGSGFYVNPVPPEDAAVMLRREENLKA
jgi:UDPglucose--hexose-1-phosphate uridylyltransferase